MRGYSTNQSVIHISSAGRILVSDAGERIGLAL